ncbi:MAG TPA: MBL fold metallo-hydrolase, partial [Hyphomicrobiaceae bacterium]|nr:MBL fold metallo-hydrolase [Hyphomicrobiaceae bacterium]
LAPRHYDPKTGKIILCIQSYVVRTKHHTILVDTCVGNDKHRPHRPFWHLQKAKTYEDGLKSVGLGFDDIDFVTCTHLHVDHVGWNTRLENGRWVPTFKNARYLMSKTELDHWTEREKKDASTCPWITDSVLPIVAANKADLVTSKHVLNDIVHFIPTPGHTIDHFSVRVGRKGADAVIAGDMIHSPIQARYPEIGMMSDYDSAQAGRSRRELFGSLCDTSTLMCTGHFASPSTGHVTRWDDGFRIE